MLTEEQKNIYSKDGYVILPSVIPQNNLLAMVNDLNQWIEESKSQKNNYGETKNGKSRFDLELYNLTLASFRTTFELYSGKYFLIILLFLLSISK